MQPFEVQEQSKARHSSPAIQQTFMEVPFYCDVANDEDDDNGVEEVGLISNTKVNHFSNNWEQSTKRRKLKVALAVGIVMTMIAILIMQSSSINGPEDQSLPDTIKCPIPLDTFTNQENVEVGKFVQQGLDLDAMNATQLWNWMHNDEDHQVDGWTRSYQEAKDRVREAVAKSILPFVSTLSTRQPVAIYESACGIGRMLAITLEILQQELHNNNITTPRFVVYGNDYVSASAKAAATLFATPQNCCGGAQIQLGSICGGVDSTNLSHVPSDSFDIVYTGYVSMLHDPLDLEGQHPNLDLDRPSLHKMYKEICHNATVVHHHHHHTDSAVIQQQLHAQQLVKQMNQVQQDWYAKWVGEMIRIAKPGSPVLVEEVPLPLCEDPHDNGGVSKDFWAARATMHDDDEWSQIDPASIVILQGHYGDGTPINRYHVAMMKKK